MTYNTKKHRNTTRSHKTNKHHTHALTALACLLALGPALPASAQEQHPAPAAELLTVVGGWESPDKLGSSAAVEGLAVELRSELLSGGEHRLSFQGFGARIYEAALERLERPMPGATTWIGRVDAFGAHSRVMLSTYEGAVSGYLDTPEARYEIVPRPGGHVMIKLDSSRFAGCDVDDEEQGGEHDHGVGRGHFDDAAKILGLDPETLLGETEERANKSTAQIDIAVLYTETTKNKVGGSSAIVSTIVSAIGTLNDAFSASNIDARANLVSTEQASQLGDTSGHDDGLVLTLFGNGSGLSNSGEQQHYENRADMSGVSESGDAFGEVLAQGDFDGDGYDDLAIGVPGEDLSSGTYNNTGMVWVLYGSGSGFNMSRDKKFHQNTSGLADSNEDGDQFGFSLAAGDFDGDGRDDLAIGVPYEDVGADTSTGRVQILYGTGSGLSGSGSQSIDQEDLSEIGPNEDHDHFGWSLAAGDFDGDGRDDLAIGVPDEDGSGEGEFGRVAVVYGSSGGLNTNDDQAFDQDDSGIETKTEPNDRFGRVLAAGDFDNDGRDDLVVGVPKEDLDGKSDAGIVHIIYGTSSGLSSSGLQNFDQGDVGGGKESGDQFGFSFAVGDFDNDGYDDLVVGAPYENSNDVGRFHLLYGGNSGLSNSGRYSTGGHSNGLLGFSFAVGDFDSDGYDDFAAGRPGYDEDDTNGSGQVKIFNGTASGYDSGSEWSQDASGVAGDAEDGDALGYALAAGDFDGDGDDDLAIGVPGEGVSNESDYFKAWMGADSQVTNLRSSSNADLVGLVVENMTDACGSAQAVLNTSSGDSSKFYQVTDRGCAVGNLTFAHEFGHLLGLAHDPANAGSSGACSSGGTKYSRGHYESGVARSLMSYDNQCSGGCSRVALISNPSVDFSSGDPSGIANQRDNARCARLTVDDVAAYN